MTELKLLELLEIRSKLIQTNIFKELHEWKFYFEWSKILFQ